MKKSFLLFLACGLILLLAACGIDVPTKSPDDETKKPGRTQSTDEAGTPSESRPDNPFRPSGSAADRLPGLQETYDTADDPANNVSYLFAGGRIVHAYGGTWFVQEGFENDGSTNGHEGSENIYFLSDEEGAEPVLAGWVPAYYSDWIQQLTVFALIPGPETAEGRFLYFFARGINQSTRYAYSYHLWRLDLASGRSEDLGLEVSLSWGRNTLARVGDTLYFTGAYGKNEAYLNDYERGYDIGLMSLDLTSGKIAQADLAIPEIKGEGSAVIGVAGGYAYYVRCRITDDEWESPYGFFRIRLAGGREEEVAPILCKDLEIACCLGNYLLYADDDSYEYVFLSTETGQEVLRMDSDRIDFLDQPFTVSGDLIYYFLNGSLQVLDLTDGSERTLIAGKDREVILITETPDYIWFMDDDDYGVYRVSKTGRILPASPLVPLPDSEQLPQSRYEGWEYVEYPNCIKVRGYRGSGESLTVPAEINGKPVTMLSLDLLDCDGVTELTVPEGVIALHHIEGTDSLAALELPRSLAFLSSGYDDTLALQSGVTIFYAGSLAEWQKVFDANRGGYYSYEGSYASCKVENVHCSDGTWHRHGEFDEKNEILKNPGFESGRIEPWVITNRAYGSDTVIQVKGTAVDAFSGAQVLSVWRKTGYIEFSAEQAAGVLPEGDYRYQISFMGGGTNSYTVYSYVTVNGSEGHRTFLTVSVPQHWDTASVYFHVNEGDEITVGIYVRLSPSPGDDDGPWGMIDGASLIRKND
ncbi:MAG: DUF5050 domain-containing protein [Lachnospiraceae bacterium]|nr:DUF5050 domain-containing protein [Lachnospiraceae bacterium]